MTCLLTVLCLLVHIKHLMSTMYMYIKCVLLLCTFITSGGDALTLIEVGGAASTPVVAPVEDTPTTKGEVPKDQMSSG